MQGSHHLPEAYGQLGSLLQEPPRAIETSAQDGLPFGGDSRLQLYVLDEFLLFVGLESAGIDPSMRH